MADPTAELLIKIGTDIKQLQTGLNAADKQVGGFAGTIKKHHRAIGVAMAAMGAAILAAAALSVKAYAQMGDEVQKMALRTGFSTEALSELRHAADLSGTSLSSLEKASKTLSGAILDAGFGLETYVRAFDKVGLSYEQLKGLSPEDQFLAVMEALAGVTDESERAALAADLFGRAGTQLLPMLADGTEGLAAMREEAHKLGIVFDQEAADKAAEFQDALTALKGATSGLQIKLAEVLIPVLLDVIEKIKEIVVGLSEWAEQHETLTKIMVFLTTALGGALLTLAPIIIMLDSLIDVWLALKVVWLSHVIPTIAKVILALKAKIATLLASKIATLLHIPVVWAFVTALWAQVTATLAAIAATGVGIPVAIAAAAAIGILATGVTLLVKEQKDQRESTEEVTEAIQDLNVKQRGAIDLTRGATGAITEQTKATRELIRAEEDRNRVIWGQVMAENARANAILRARRAEAGVGERPFGGAVTMGGLEKMIEAGFFTTESWEKLVLPYMQEGGIVRKPTLAMVGEGGPEAVVPLDRAMGGITINFTEPVFMEREESMNKLADRIYRVIKKDQRLSFGGAYSG